MLTEEEVLEIVDAIIPKLKKSDNFTFRKKKDDAPDYYPTYKMCVEFAERTKIHAEVGGKFPEKIFVHRAPNQTDKEYDYIKANFKQTTLPVYLDYHSTIMRAMSDGNWSITYQEDSEKYKSLNETLQEYLEKKIKVFTSLENYVKDAMVHLKDVDANGVIAIKPDEIPMLKGDDGEYYFDSGKLSEPQPVYYRADQKIGKKYGVYFLIHLDEKSPVTNGEKNQDLGHIFELYDNTNIWRITQVGKFSDYKFQYEIYFTHGWEKIPVVELGGVPVIIGPEVIWMPKFLYACDLLDLALMNSQYLQTSIAGTCFPYRVMLGNRCSFQYTDDSGQVNLCDNGDIYDSSIQGLKKCPSCNGSGLKDRVSPMGQMLLNPKTSTSDGDVTIAGNAMYYVSPETASLEFVEKKVEIDTEKARKILHLQTSNSVTKGTENLTATGMGIDMKAMYAFIKPESDQIFSRMEFIIDAIGWMRYGKDYKKPLLLYPNTFDFNTEQDYLSQISELQKAGAPPFLLHTVIYNYLKTIYYNEKKTADVFMLIEKTDRIMTLSQDDINLKLSRGTVDKWESVLHDSAIIFIDELEKKNKKFFDQDFLIQQQQLAEKAKEVTATIQSEGQSQTNGLIDSITNSGGGTASV